MKYPSSLRLHGPSIGNIDIGIYTPPKHTEVPNLLLDFLMGWSCLGGQEAKLVEKLRNMLFCLCQPHRTIATHSSEWK